MRAAAKELEFERAAALRDEIQQIRLRVLEQDASIIVGRAAERAARVAGSGAATGLTGAADRNRGRRAAEAAAADPGSALEVTSVTVLPAEDEPAATLDGEPGGEDGEGTAVGLAAGHPRRARRHGQAGRPAGPSGRRGIGRSRPTSASAPDSDRVAAVAEASDRCDRRCLRCRRCR